MILGEAHHAAGAARRPLAQAYVQHLAGVGTRGEQGVVAADPQGVCQARCLDFVVLVAEGLRHLYLCAERGRWIAGKGTVDFFS